MLKAMKGDARATAKLLDLAMSGGEFERDMSQNIMKIALVKPKPPS